MRLTETEAEVLAAALSRLPDRPAGCTCTLAWEVNQHRADAWWEPRRKACEPHTDPQVWAQLKRLGAL